MVWRKMKYIKKKCLLSREKIEYPTFLPFTEQMNMYNPNSSDWALSGSCLEFQPTEISTKLNGVNQELIQLRKRYHDKNVESVMI